VDASFEMLRVAAEREGREQVGARFSRADAHTLPFADGSFDAAVCLRVLMHAVDWPQVVAEVCRVARWRVVVDFPSRRSFAALESTFRSARKRRGAAVEAYRVMSLSAVADALGARGFRVVRVERQFVLPIALHKRVGRLGLTRGVEGALAAVGLLRLFGSPVTVVAER
jgi:SAM-dependent methyltransferase